MEPGGIWGIAQTGKLSTALIVFRAIAIPAIVYLLLRTPASDKLLLLALTLFCAGAVGNLYDNLVFEKGVRDFLDFYLVGEAWLPLAHVQRGRQLHLERSHSCDCRDALREAAPPAKTRFHVFVVRMVPRVDVDLSVSLASLRLKNPVLSASGTYGHGLEMSKFVAPAKLGALVGKTVTLRPRPGNAPPRMAETPSGMLNSIGLENRGIAHYREKVLPTLRDCGTLVISNIGAETIDDFAALAEQLDGEPVVAALEVNLSCPNIQGKVAFLDRLPPRGIGDRGRPQTHKKPVFAKLSPNVTSIAEIAKAVEGRGPTA